MDIYAYLFEDEVWEEEMQSFLLWGSHGEDRDKGMWRSQASPWPWPYVHLSAEWTQQKQREEEEEEEEELAFGFH